MLMMTRDCGFSLIWQFTSLFQPALTPLLVFKLQPNGCVPSSCIGCSVKLNSFCDFHIGLCVALAIGAHLTLGGCTAL